MTNHSSDTPRYTTFYLVMLILTSVGVGISAIASLVGIPEAIRMLSFAQAYGIGQIIGIVATVISIPALILLWMKKNPSGFYLLLGTYAVIILISIASFFFLEPVIQDASVRALKESPEIPAETINSLTSFGIYAVSVLQLIVNFVMVTLWWFAFRSQRRADEDNIESPKTDK